MPIYRDNVMWVLDVDIELESYSEMFAGGMLPNYYSQV